MSIKLNRQVAEIERRIAAIEEKLQKMIEKNTLQPVKRPYQSRRKKVIQHGADVSQPTSTDPSE